MRLTKTGQRLLSKCIAEGFELHFTKMSLGDGLLTPEEKISELEGLKSWQLDLPLTELEVVGNGTAKLTAHLDNAEVERGFAAREHGLYCVNEIGEEVLFSYRNTGEFEYDFIPAAGKDIIKNIFVSEIVEVRDAANVTAVLDLSVAYVSVPDFKEHINSSAPHPNAPTKLDDVESTGEIWATDHDSHLHKISVDKLRELLNADKVRECKVRESEDVTALQNELGLAANILMLEDFSDEVVTDYFKTKVTSYAEHGNLLGLESPEKLKSGGLYVLSDGENAEEVEISAVVKNASGYHARLKNPVANTYAVKYLNLYRTTPAPCDKKKCVWRGCDFVGVKANITNAVELENYFEIEGDGFYDGEYLTLG